MDKPLLREKEIYPSDEVLAQVLGKSFMAWSELTTALTGMNLSLEWTYYNDGKSWLCKVCRKKKTVLWLSVWGKFFKTTFYFTEKHLEAFALLNIDNSIKEALALAKPIGRLLPLVISIENKKPLDDILKIAEYKSNLK